MRTRSFYPYVILSALLVLCSTLHANQAPTYSDKPSVLVPTPPYNPGMFSVFTSILGALHLYDIGTYSGIKICLESGIYYDPAVGPNWWEYFFEPIALGIQNPSKQHVLSENELGKLAYHTLFDINRPRAHQLIEKYVSIKPHIQDKVTQFVQNNFTDSYIIGIHYRGTDKVQDAIPMASIFSIIQKFIDGNPLISSSNYKIFVATDEQPFIEAIKTYFTCPILYLDIIRSVNGQPVHISYYTSNYQKGEDALLDCMLLSQCNIIFPIQSNLSTCSGYFNPSIPYVPLNVLDSRCWVNFWGIN